MKQVAELPPPPVEKAPKKKGGRISPTKGRKSPTKTNGQEEKKAEKKEEKKEVGKKGKKNAKIAPVPEEEEEKEDTFLTEPQPQPLEEKSEIEEIMLPEGGDMADAMLQDIANEAVNGVVSSVIGLIKRGELQQHAPARAWGTNNNGQDRRDRVLAQKRYNRIQRLLAQAESGKIDAQNELLKINKQLNRDPITGISAEDILVDDLKALIVAKEDRKKELALKKQMRKQKQAQKTKDLKKAEKRQRDLDRQFHRMRELEQIMNERKEKDDEMRAERAAEKERERQKHEEMTRNFRNQTNQRLGQVPLYKRMDRRYKKKVEIPELEKRKKHLAQIRNDMRNPHFVDIKAHEEKIRDWEADERNRLAEHIVPKNEIPNHLKQNKFHRETKRRDAEQMEKLRKAKELKAKIKKHQDEYSQKVREQHKPHVDAQKAAQMELLAHNVDIERAQQMRMRGDQQLKNAGDNLRAGYKNVNGELDPSEVRRRKKKPVEEKPPEKPKDYLQDLKAQRKPRKAKKNSEAPLSPAQMAEKIRQKERDALKKEEKLKQGDVDVDTTVEVSDIYCGVIADKLKLLGELS